MRKVFKVENIDCAHCAAKMEEAANKVAGVNKATLNFLTKKLIINAEDASFNEIIDEVQKAIQKIDYEVEIIR